MTELSREEIIERLHGNIDRIAEMVIDAENRAQRAEAELEAVRQAVAADDDEDTVSAVNESIAVVTDYARRLQRAEAECERLRGTLRFYAEGRHWGYGLASGDGVESGAKAAEALATPPPEGEPENDGCELCGRSPDEIADAGCCQIAPHTPEQHAYNPMETVDYTDDFDGGQDFNGPEHWAGTWDEQADVPLCDWKPGMRNTPEQASTMDHGGVGQVGCEGGDGLLRVHAEDESCDVCAPEQAEGEQEYEAHHTLFHFPREDQLVNEPEQAHATPLARLVAYAIHGGMDMPEADECRRQLLADNTPAEQAHGDALAELEFLETCAAQGTDGSMREAAINSVSVIRRHMTASGVPDDDAVEQYIRSLPWSDNADENEKALVAGNIRTFYQWLIAAAPTDGRE